MVQRLTSKDGVDWGIRAAASYIWRPASRSSGSSTRWTRGVFYAVSGRLWTPLDYLSPFLAVRAKALGDEHTWLLWAIALWSLPFMWIALTLRRCIDAGRSPWLSLLVLVLGINYALMQGSARCPRPRPSTSHRSRSTLHPRVYGRT